MSRGGGRIERQFAALANEGRTGFVAFITAGDPDQAISADLLNALPGAGADLIELGMPFSDPMADGPVIQASSQRALKAGMTLGKTLEMVSAFRDNDETTPIVLMGYFNPILFYGVEAFAKAAAAAGVDGLIVVDLPPEEEAELADPARRAGLRLIRLAAPTSLGARLERVLDGAEGFLYYISMTGISGDSIPVGANVLRAIDELKEASSLPVAVGFGIKSVADVKALAGHADAVVVGSAIVEQIAANLDEEGGAKPDLAKKVLDFVRQLTESGRLS
jgi:tryptophan synthase alpha chain